jgi:hypothetical protein
VTVLDALAGWQWFVLVYFLLVSLAVAVPLGAVAPAFAVLFFAVAYGYGLVMNLFALVLEDLGARRYDGVRDRLLLLVWATVESLGYRQLTVYWRIRGLVRRMRGSRDWGVMTRTGFARDPAPTP